MKIVAIAGSPRGNSNTSYLTDHALKEAAESGIETEKIILAQYKINPCQAHSECRNLASCCQKDDMEWILSKVYEADGIILATPVYFYNVTAQMKAFMDRNVFRYRRQQKMKARCAGIIVVAGAAGLQDSANNLTRFITAVTNITADDIIQVDGLAGAEGAIKDNAKAVASSRSMGLEMAKKLLDR